MMASFSDLPVRHSPVSFRAVRLQSWDEVVSDARRRFVFFGSGPAAAHSPRHLKLTRTGSHREVSHPPQIRSKTYALPVNGYCQAGTSALDHGTAHAAVMSGPFQVLIA
jgi:hypothetical protein